MSSQGGNAFGGGDYIRDQFPDTYEDYLAKKAGKEPGSNKLVTFDNEIGEVTLRLPPKLSHHQAELIEALTDEFYGTAAGDRKVQEDMNTFVVEWLKKKEAEEARGLES